MQLRWMNIKTDEYTEYMAALDQWKKDKKLWEKADEMDVDSDDEPLKVSMPRKPKDAKCPKRPLTSYFLYAKDVRAATKAEFPNKAITEIAKEISKKWKLLTEEEKKPFVDEAASLKEQYKKDIEEYTGSEAQLAFKAKLDEWKQTCEDRKRDAKVKAQKKKEREEQKNKKSPKKKSPTKKKKGQKNRDEWRKVRMMRVHRMNIVVTVEVIRVIVARRRIVIRIRVRDLNRAPIKLLIKKRMREIVVVDYN